MNYNVIFKWLIVSILLVFILKENSYCQKKLRLHFISNFKKNETFKIYANDSIYVIKNNRYHLFKAIDIYLPDSILDGDRIPVFIDHKFWYNIFYSDTDIEIYYKSDMKYLFVNRDYRQKGHYAVEYLWTNNPIQYGYNSLKNNGFFDNESVPEIYKPDKIYANPYIIKQLK